jgi:hypothetical protein
VLPSAKVPHRSSKQPNKSVNAPPLRNAPGKKKNTPHNSSVNAR